MYTYKVTHTEPTRMNYLDSYLHTIVEKHIFRDFKYITQHFNSIPTGATDEMQCELIKDNHIHPLYKNYKYYMLYPKNSIPIQYIFGEKTNVGSKIYIVESISSCFPDAAVEKYGYMAPFFRTLLQEQETFDEFLTKAKEANKYVKLHIVVHEQIKQEDDKTKITSLKNIATEKILSNLHQPDDLGLEEEGHDKTRPSSLPYTPTKDISDVKKLQFGIIYQSPVSAENDDIEKNLTAKLKDYWNDIKNNFDRTEEFNVTMSFSLEHSNDENSSLCCLS